MIIYKVTFPNNKVYIGLTNGKLGDRKAKHYKDMRKGSDLLFHRALKKHQGSETWEVIDTRENRKDLCEAERFHIEKYKSNDREFGYNCTPGGDGRSGPLSDEHKQNIRIAKGAKKVFVFTIEGVFFCEFNSMMECSNKLNVDLRNVASICKGNGGNSAKGYTFGFSKEDCIENIKRNQTTHYHSSATKNKISESNKKTKSTEENRIKQSISRVGNRLFYCYKINGEFIGEYQSIAMCSRQLNIAESNISFCLTNFKKYAKEYVFDFNKEICEEKSKTTKKTKYRWFAVCNGDIELYRFNKHKDAENTLNIDKEKIRGFLRNNGKDDLGRSYRYIE